MADLSDVMDALEQIALQAVFPNGTNQPSVLPTKPPQVAQGWPLARDIDKAMAAGRSIVSIFAVPSSSSDAGQPFLTTDAVYVAPVHGMAATVSGSRVTLTGAPGLGEYITAVVDGIGYSYLTQTGDTASSTATGLASALQAAFPGTAASGATVQIATNQDFDIRIGAPATMATRIHRQRIQFRICVWSPNPADRAALSRAVDVALKRNVTIRLEDQTQAMVVFQGTNLDDKYENEGAYRRDLIFNVTFDTLDTYPAFEVTVVQTPVSSLP
ncbi:hypothetical protein MKK88_01165 [Methylobacterium sp. E-005]|uniref:hypothetical protein n=1 Tax=Methylobacterium sp. E-005 TaxID=2836549 RepID=UPI001FB8C0B4|nr:hypothetical protein [Methylobacterium sp. E-005]MCJ2084606.1 hypothetical protein [Methylobacterium sp. E-005]